MALEAQDNPFPSILMRETVDPANPAAGDQRLFVDTDHLFKMVDSAGTVTTFGTGTTVATDTIWDAAGDLAVGTGANTAARVAIGASGLVLKSNGTTAAWAFPAFRGAKVWNSGTQTMNGSGTNGGVTTLTFDSEEYDTDAFHDTSSNTGRLTIPAGMTGKYEIGFMAYGTPLSAGTTIDIYVNAAIATHHGMRVARTDTATGTWVGNAQASLTAADYLELRLTNPNAGTFTIGHASAQVVMSAFWCHLIGVA